MNTNKPTHEPEPNGRPVALGIAIVAGFLAAILRVVPHPPNFYAVGGLGLFGGARLQGWRAYLLPLGIMILSDLVLWIVTGFDVRYSFADVMRVPVYASFMLYVVIGRWLQRRDSIGSVTLAATLGGLQFFVLTNFFDWLVQPYQPYYDQIPEFFRYSRDGAGLVKCFVVALGFYQHDGSVLGHPFMIYTNFPTAMLVWPILADIVFTTVYLQVYAKLTQREAQPAREAMVESRGAA